MKLNSILAAAAIWRLINRELKVKTTFNQCQLVQLLEVNMFVVLFHQLEPYKLDQPTGNTVRTVIRPTETIISAISVSDSM